MLARRGSSPRALVCAPRLTPGGASVARARWQEASEYRDRIQQLESGAAEGSFLAERFNFGSEHEVDAARARISERVESLCLNKTPEQMKQTIRQLACTRLLALSRSLRSAGLAFVAISQASRARAQVLTRPALFATHSTLVFRMAAADADIEQQNTALQVVRYDPLHKSRQSPCLFFTLCPAGFDEGGEEARRRAKVARVRDEDGSSHDR